MKMRRIKSLKKGEGRGIAARVAVSMCVCLVTQLCLTLCDPMDLTFPYGARQAPLSMEFSRQEYWRGLPFPSPGGAVR